MTQKTATAQSELSTSTIGRHSELLAMAALLADGWSVSEPTVPEAHDLIASKDGQQMRIQVKTIKQREKDGTPYYVIRGLKNNREVYSLSDCDAFIGVVGEHVYLTECRAISEYWVRVDEASEKWNYLPLKITEKGAIN